jgi:hypothetical protein
MSIKRMSFRRPAAAGTNTVLVGTPRMGCSAGTRAFG